MRWMVLIGFFILIVIAAAVLVVVPAPTAQAPTVPPQNFVQCSKYFPVTQSYPRTCTTNLGQTFTENIGNAIQMQNTIVVDTPKPSDMISSPLTITGKALGSWYFEAQFPIEVLDDSGNVIGQGQGEALSDWTTADFVNFTATLTFPPQLAGSGGVLVLKNDNPSGDPSKQQELDIPINF